ncbi:hypothetical protein [Polycladidibacter hongkongensis]|uniref:hypothetical protein n=1 Tax=Polycladidibacter hongkongensis TaxID=1647556 RepID=UPI000832D261|nr:hypothetical protein [Pseudovibrio hongkongensis]
MSNPAPVTLMEHTDAPCEITDVASYCEQMCLELKTLAAQNDLVFLSYLLEMAAKEAAEVAGGPQTKQ